jgi:beta-glucosidase
VSTNDTTHTADDDLEQRIASILAAMTLDEKVSLTGGADVWHLPPVAQVGVGSLKMSDGPSGVRGDRFGARRSLSFPCGMAVGANWDVDLAARYGVALAHEARAKGVHLLLGPTICIPRTPLAGRTFESFAEDPVLTAALTVAYVQGVQSLGVGCCVKHFACNDQEHERMTISAEVDETTLRELHLPAFEAAVRAAGAWSVMSAYNRLNGTYCGEHPWLLGEVLKGEWGFDGVVVSDWFGTHSTDDAAVAGLDVEMPGPPAFLGRKLAEAVRAGRVDEAVVDDHARRILRLAARTGALAPAGEAASPRPAEVQHEASPADRQVAHELAVGGTVLLRNDGVLPLAADVRRLALIGPSSRYLVTGGGGSSEVTPFRLVSLADELGRRFPGATIVHEPGCVLGEGVPPVEPQLVAHGLQVEYLGADGTVLGSEQVLVGRLVTMGDPLPGVDIAGVSIRATGPFRPDTSGVWQLGITSTAGCQVFVDGALVLDNSDPTPGEAFYGLGSTQVTGEVALEAGRDYEVTVVMQARGLPLAGFEIAAARPHRDDLLGAAVAAASAADVAIVVVGSNAVLETEGADRAGLQLPGDQDELVRQVAAANPRTVVVLNAGSPVTVPWANVRGALLALWYPGEEGASALVEVLAGDADPSGRLPITFPVRLEDTPTHGPWYPGADGQVVYGEGVLVGIATTWRRGWRRRSRSGTGCRTPRSSSARRWCRAMRPPACRCTCRSPTPASGPAAPWCSCTSATRTTRGRTPCRPCARSPRCTWSRASPRWPT